MLSSSRSFFHTDVWKIIHQKGREGKRWLLPFPLSTSPASARLNRQAHLLAARTHSLLHAPQKLEDVLPVAPLVLRPPQLTQELAVPQPLL